MPWEVIAKHLDRYLRLRYLSATVAGLSLVVELVFLSLPGTPPHRRDFVARVAGRVSTANLSPLVILLSAILALIASYLIGSLARSLTVSLLLFLNELWTPLSQLVAGPVSWVTRQLVRVPLTQPAARTFSHLLTPFKAAAGPLFGVRASSEAMWGYLKDSYGEEELARSLQRHPIHLNVGDDNQRIKSSFEYCDLWLQRYAKDLAIPTEARRFEVLLYALLPVSLAPFTVAAIGGDVAQLAFWANVAGVGALLLIAALFIRELKHGDLPLVVVLTVYRFIVVQMLENARPHTEAAETKTAS